MTHPDSPYGPAESGPAESGPAGPAGPAPAPAAALAPSGAFVPHAGPNGGAPGQAGTGKPARFLSWQGIQTVMTLELRQRVRSTRWKIALGAFFGIVGLVTILMVSFLATEDMDAGRWVYELILLFVLGLGLLVTPTLSSTAINGDRQAGTLAILQITKLSPADLAFGKLLAGWVASLAFLVVSLPFLIWTWLISEFGFGRFIFGLVTLALLLVVVCAFSLGFSAITNRPAGSSVLSYLMVGSLTVIGLIIFGLTVPLVTTDRTVDVYVVPSNSNDECVWEEQVRPVVHTDRTWWLLVVNPFVVLADAAAPRTDADFFSAGGPLDGIRFAVQAARTGPEMNIDQCWSDNYGDDAPAQLGPNEVSDAAIWPWGLGLNLLIGAGGVALAIRRLAVPYRKLPKGARVA